MSAMVRIVIPAHGAAATLRDCIASVVQNLRDAPVTGEIVVVDDGDNGDIAQLLDGFAVQLVHTDARNAAVARNVGTAGFTGDILVFVDADVRLDAGAINRLLVPLIRDSADATFGNYSRDVTGLHFFQQYKQLYISRIYSRKHENLQYFFWTAIGAVKTDVFRELGEFSPGLPGRIGEDVEFGQTLTRCGKRVAMVPDATGRHLKEYRFLSLVGNDFRKGVSSVFLSLQNAVPVTSNPHATRIDAVAALYAFMALMLCLLVWCVPCANALKNVASGLLLLPYLVFRREFIVLQVQQGWFFALQSLPVMYFLDVVRIASVLAGLAAYVLSCVQRNNK